MNQFFYVAAIALGSAMIGGCTGSRPNSESNEGAPTAEYLHDAVMPIFLDPRNVSSEASNILRGRKEGNAIKVYTANSGNDWLRICAGSDTLFMLKHDDIEPIIVTRSAQDREKTVKCVVALAQVLPPLIGYDSTLKILSPFFDKASSQFYFGKLALAEEKVKAIILTGQPSIEGGFRSTSQTTGKEYSCRYYGAGWWSLDHFDQKSANYWNINSPWSMNSEYKSCADLTVHFNRLTYSCGLFGCSKAVETEDGWKYASISLDEFKEKTRESMPF